MQKSTTKRRVFGVLGVLGAVLASQVLTACVVVPVPHRHHRAVIVQPGYSGPPPYHHHHRDWRR
jgi:hypothetical protein